MWFLHLFATRVRFHKIFELHPAEISITTDARFLHSFSGTTESALLEGALPCGNPEKERQRKEREDAQLSQLCTLPQLGDNDWIERGLGVAKLLREERQVLHSALGNKAAHRPVKHPAPHQAKDLVRSKRGR